MTVSNRITGVETSLGIKAPCRVATTANILLDGSVTTLDGVTLAAGDRVLVKDQTDETENGIYVVQTSGAWARAEDFNGSRDATKGTMVLVTDGAQSAQSPFMLDEASPVIGTSDLNFVPVQAFASAGTVYAYDTMEDLIADGDRFQTSTASGARQIVKIKGGREIGDGGAAELLIEKTTGSPTWFNTGFIKVAAGGKIALGSANGARITWPEGVLNGVAMGMRAMEWVSGTEVAKQAASAAGCDAIFDAITNDDILDDEEGITFHIPKGTFYHYERFKVEDASSCAVEGDGVGRTILYAGRFYEGDGTTPKYDDGAGAPNASIPMTSRFEFLRGTYNTFRRLDYRGGWFCNRGFWMRSGFGLIEDCYAEETGGRPFGCGNEDADSLELNGQLFNQTMRNLEARRAIGTAFSARGVKRYNADNLRAFECWAEGITADNCDEAVIEGCYVVDVCRQDRAAGYPAEDLWEDLGGVGGVGAIAPSENSLLTGVHNCRINGVSEDASAGTRSKPGIRWRAKTQDASGFIATGNHFNDMGVGISIDSFYNSDDTTTYVNRNFCISGNNFTNVGTADGQGQGHVQVDSGARNGVITGNSADEDFKIFGYVDKSSGTPDGTLSDNPSHLHTSIVYADNARDRVTATTNLISGTGTNFDGPRGLREVNVFLRGISFTGTDDLFIRLLDKDGTAEAGSYVGTMEVSANGVAPAVSTSGITAFRIPIGSAALSFTGFIQIVQVNRTTNEWLLRAEGYLSTGTVVRSYGLKTLTNGPLGGIRLASSGTDEFDNTGSGRVRIDWGE
jgi:hypothetical protein